ncbi:MAG: RNA recognition motif-containing protein [Glaciecola sp.]|jgi:RNA recognition motif-containing protein|tara:strand:+ start:504 stop:779 length:276 start_codon:yes stop_codon:yes gene_type:complete
MKLIIRNLARSTTQESLNALFTEIGLVQSCSLVIDKATGKSKGFAFVEMPKIGEAKIAIGKLNNMDLDGSKIRVKKAEQAAADADKKDTSN